MPQNFPRKIECREDYRHLKGEVVFLGKPSPPAPLPEGEGSSFSPLPLGEGVGVRVGVRVGHLFEIFDALRLSP